MDRVVVGYAVLNLYTGNDPPLLKVINIVFYFYSYAGLYGISTRATILTMDRVLV
jgi:hypothetical protein